MIRTARGRRPTIEGGPAREPGRIPQWRSELRRIYPWIRTVGWSLLGGVLGYALPLLLALGALAETGDSSSRTYRTMGLVVGVGVEPRTLLVCILASLLLAAAVAAWRIRPWAGPAEEEAE